MKSQANWLPAGYESRFADHVLLALGQRPSSLQRPLFTRDVTRCDGSPSHEFDFVFFALLSFGDGGLVRDVAVFEPLGGGPFGVFLVPFAPISFGDGGLVRGVAVFEPLGGGPFGVFFVPFAPLSFGDGGLVRGVAVFERLDGVARGIVFDACFLAIDPDFDGGGT